MFKPKTIKKLLKKKYAIIAPFLVLLLLFTAYNLAFLGKIFPKIYIADLNVGGKTQKEAEKMLSENIIYPTQISFIFENQSFEVPVNQLDVKYDLTKSTKNAFLVGRSGNILSDFTQRIKNLFTPQSLGLSVSINEEKLATILNSYSEKISQPPTYPSISLVNGKIVIDKGKTGTSMNIQKARLEIGENLTFVKNDPIKLELIITDPTLDESQAQNLKTRAENLLVKKIVLNSEEQTIELKGSDLIKLIDPKGEYNEEHLSDLISSISSQIDRQPQDSVFVFEGGIIKEFTPSKNGLILKKDSFKEMLTGNLRTLESGGDTSINIDLPIAVTPPKIQTGDVNNLGIKELIGKGVSHFAHSIPNRIYNIQLAASKFKSVLVAPGDTLSFNSIVGDVSSSTGYKQAYIIQSGRTVLGDGGGVCQVSTTLFRAALNTGLPIIQRVAHAYRVGYYEQDSPPGLDATVFYPTADLKIKNDTAAHILIQSTFNPKDVSLTFEIYGTKDGRKATISKPVVSNQTPPPDDLYQDDPTLPAGTIKQVDFKAWGAKVVFNYKVENAGKTTFNKTFVSNYQPWQAIYSRGTGPAQ